MGITPKCFNCDLCEQVDDEIFICQNKSSREFENVVDPISVCESHVKAKNFLDYIFHDEPLPESWTK